MTLQLARHSVAKYYTGEVRRSLQVLPDGKYAILTFDNNRSDSSYGDQTNVAKGYIRVVDPAGEDVVLGTVSFPIFGKAGLPATSMQGAVAVDNSGNLHVAYTYHAEPQNGNPTLQNQTIRYIKATRLANTFTLSSPETVFAHSADEAIASVDIDIPGNSGAYPVIVNTFTNWNTNKSFVALHNRQVGSTWLKLHIQEVDGLYHFPSVSIATRTDTEASAFSFVVTYTTVPISADQGDFIFTGRANLGGAYVGTVQAWKAGLNKHQNDGWREFSAFHLADGIFLVAGTTGVDPFRPLFAALKVIQASGVVTTVKSPYANFDYGGRYVKHANIPFSAWNIVRETNGGKIISYHYDSDFVYANIFDYTLFGDDLTINPVPHRVVVNQDISQFNSAYPLTVMAGDHGRHSTSKDLACGIAYGQPSWRYLISTLDEPIQSLNITPQNNSYTSSAHPMLAARPNGTNQGNIIARVEFEVALDVNFASGLVDDINSGYIWINGANIAEGFVLNATLVQGEYYLRSRIRDIMGNTGAWSPITSFTVRHQPSATGLSPAGGGFLGWNPTTGATLHWNFTDPDPTDTQTAYQVVLRDSQSGSVVHDTGKVFSNADSVNIPAPESSTEKILVWSLTVWDRDDVASSGIPDSSFYLSKAPIVTLITPASSTVSTADPIVSWTSTFFGGRTQQAYRVWIYRIADRKTVYDSGFKFSTQASNQVPAGILRNNTDYALQVIVQDTNGLQGREFFAFETQWPLPMLCDPPVVDLNEYRKKGFAYVTAFIPDVSGYVNKDFIVAYSIYRRTYESAGDEWVLLWHGMPSGSEFVSYKDYLLPSGIPSEYAFTMTIDIYGEIQVGNPEHAKATRVKPEVNDYWLMNADDFSQSLLLPHVTNDGWTDEYEQQDFVIIGRGRVVEVGDRIGNSGSLTSQLRDTGNGLPGVPVFNSVSNARLVTDTTGDALASWFVVPSSGTNCVFAELPSFAACPTTRDGMLNIELTNSNGNPNSMFIQDVFRIDEGGNHYLSIWTEASKSLPGVFLDVKVEFWNSELDNGSILATYQERVSFTTSGGYPTAIIDGVIAPIDFQSAPGYHWYRLDIPMSAPIWSVKAKITLTLDSTVSRNVIGVNLGGIALTDHPSRFFDGYNIDAEWVGEPDVDPSYTPGSYTARKMRQNIEAMKRNDSEVYLRTPFGDMHRVAVGSMSISRIAGVGSNEFVDVTIPYLEISGD